METSTSYVYPWQEKLAEAVTATNGLRAKVRIAEAAVEHRIREIGGGQCSRDEINAIRDAQHTLATLRRELRQSQ